MPAKIRLAHLPTPIEHVARLGDAMGVTLWVKRDDATGGAESGNKMRKLEYLLADAMAEVRRQLDAGDAGGAPFDVVVHACGSGGTAAGVALGAGQHRVAAEARAMAVCDDEAYFTGVIDGLITACRALDASLADPA